MPVPKSLDGAGAEPRWFRLFTPLGSQVACDADGRLRHAPAELLDLADAVLLCRPFDAAPFGFLLAVDGRRFRATRNWHAGVAIAVQITHAGSASQAGLSNPTRANYFYANPPPDSKTPGDVRIDHTSLGPAETFRLEPVAGVDGLPDDLVEMGRRLGDLLPDVHRPPALAERLKGPAEPPNWPALDAALQTLDHFAFDQFAGTAGADVHLAGALARACPGDPWLSGGLQPLAAWAQQRDGFQPASVIGPELDLLASAGWEGTYASMGHRLVAAARRTVVPRAKSAIVTTARDEGPYLLEWIAYHQVVGVDAIIIYSNDNSDGSDALLRLLAEAGVITWIQNRMGPRCPVQQKTYGHALSMLPVVLDCEWTLVIDIDEFVAFDAERYASWPDYLAAREVQNVDAIQLNWLIFGSNGESTMRPGGVLERFDRRLPYIDVHTKTVSRTRLFMHSQPHIPICDDRTAPVVRSAAGELIVNRHGGGMRPHLPGQRADQAWINHYFFKSADEMLWKWSRNRGGSPSDTGGGLNLVPDLVRQFAEQHGASNHLPDRRALACAPRVSEAVARLEAIDGVASALRSIAACFENRVNEARAALLDPGNTYADGSPEQRLAALLRQSGGSGER